MNNTYKLINYFDVWKEDDMDGGFTWQVNNLCEEGELVLDEHATHDEMIAALIAFGFFKPHVNIDLLEIWDDGDMIEFYQHSDNLPLCRLEKVYK